MPTVETTDQERADLAAMPEADRRVLAAFRQAMADYGLPAHPAGKCPRSPCPCSDLTEAIAAHVVALLADPDAPPCIDCWVPLPLNVTSYAVDGAGVCGPCGIRRYGDRADEYLINEGFPIPHPIISDVPDWDETEHVDPQTWTKHTIIRHLYSHDPTFYFTSSDTKRELVEYHRKMHAPKETT